MVAKVTYTYNYGQCCLLFAQVIYPYTYGQCSLLFAGITYTYNYGQCYLLFAGISAAVVLFHCCIRETSVFWIYVPDLNYIANMCSHWV